VSAIAERYLAVCKRVADAADCVGRKADDITVVAISKTVGPAEIRQAIVAGMRDFGENRAQDFVTKHALFPEMRWHFVGTLQSNKVGMVVGKAALIHSVDSIKLLKAIDTKARSLGIHQRVLLEVNVSGELSKHGFPLERVEEALRSASTLTNVEVRGLMTMAPLARPEAVRPVFKQLARLFAQYAGMRFNKVDLTELSMGMTNDFTIGIEEGATIVRVGRAIFGNK
jgi:pyridoxal phosphate enzyme (YggS family)